jgi:hypothetical protein
VTVIGDSVLVGASYEPSLPTLLAQQGWGPVRFRAGLGYTAGRQQPRNSNFSAPADPHATPAGACPERRRHPTTTSLCGADLACNAGK